MTDKTPDVMSEAHGREIVGRSSFEKEAIWLPLLAVHTLNAGKTAIEGKTFTDCVIEGPAVVASLGGTTFESCVMGAARDANSLLFTPRGPRLVGVIGLKDCPFVRCRFVQIGYTGADEHLDELATQLTSMTKGKS